MAGYFGGGSPGMGMMNPMATGMNPQMMAMLAQMQNQGGGAPGGAAPQMPMMPKSPTNAGAMPSPIASQPQNPMIAQLMQNPGMLQNLLRSLGGGMGAPGGQQMGSYTMPQGSNGFGSSWLQPGMSFNW